MSATERADGLRLVLLRHAQAEPAGGRPDHDRPLSLDGRRRGAKVAALLAEHGLAPDAVLVSSALRTRQTWELVRAGLADAPTATVTDRLYEARVGDLVEVLASVPADARTVLVVGHEPTMSTAAEVLSARGEQPELRARVQAGLPTAGLAVLEVPAWADLVPGAGALRAVLRP